MRDAFHYRVIDEPRPGPLSRFALPPLLVFMAGTFFLPWGYLLLAANAVTLGGPRRNREIAFSLAPILLYYLSLALTAVAVRADILARGAAPYVFVAFVGGGLTFAAFAYISQAHAFELRRYLAETTR